jgi:DNA-directed RNA polymerase subunit K/omega
MPTPIDKLVIIEKITQRVSNRYEAVRVMAKEARRINSLIIRGAEADADFKPTSAAVDRVITGRVEYSYVEEEAGSGDFFDED